ncbi:methylamine utilization protein [Trinickia terrae]|uniref:methylamine utilization protein n=1 Tax=Trinickia terrae TaxID=2571161 RepID=UPI001F0E4B6F|nr:methylamine utilization protein [Trinickia terrae]
MTGTGALAASGAAAGIVHVHVVDENGAPAANAVVYATPVDGKLPKRRPASTSIAQQNKTFVPLVSVVQTGAAVNLPNLDAIAHDVYSLSPAKRFELKLYRGIPPRPVVFDKPGLVVLGCNIHDTMIAYLLVVDTPYFAKTDANGDAVLADVPAERYRLTAWHYRQSDPKAQQTKEVDAATDNAVTFVMNLDTP